MTGVQTCALPIYPAGCAAELRGRSVRFAVAARGGVRPAGRDPAVPSDGSAGRVSRKGTGMSENAVKTQIWCAVSTYVLIAIVKKELQLNASLYTLLQILSVSVFEKNQLLCALRPDDQHIETPSDANQLNLFGI